MFDTHSHIQFKIFDQVRSSLIGNAVNSGVEKIIAVGTNLETSKKASEVANKYPAVFASVGIHPHHVFEHFHSQIEIRNHLIEIEKLASGKKVVAIGETGIDRHEYPNTKYPNYEINEEFINLQREVFVMQIRLALKLSKTLIIHNRKAIEDTLSVLNQEWSSELEKKSVFHMCEPDKSLLEFALKRNIFISIGGDVTFDNQKQEFIKEVPLKLLVLETDSPFFIPEPAKSKNSLCNEPANIKLIAQKVAQILNLEETEVKKLTHQNSNKLFNFS
jgi:TatD DNase family protein